MPTPTAFGSASLNWGSGIEALLPANADPTSPNVSIRSISCASAGNCSAVGSYTDNASHTQGLLLSETSGAWATGVEAALPANAAANPHAFIGSISCASLGNCSAVGSYTDNGGHDQGLLLSESSGTWATAVEAALPANAAGNPFAFIGRISCASVGNCGAEGNYTDNAGHSQGLLLSESWGTWATGVEATPPANADPTNPQVAINSISCSSAGNCAGVGYYVDTSSHIQGLLLTESSGTWASGVGATLPANANPNANAQINSVSCPSAGNCSAVGYYVDTSSHTQVLLLSESSGTWATGVEAALPANASPTDPNASVNFVSCPAVGNCSAVGGYRDSSSHSQGLLLSESSGTWATGVEAALPANVGTDPQVFIPSVSCPSVGNCGAVGYYTDSAGGQQGLLLTESSGSWGAGIKAGLPADAGSPDPVVNLRSLSCPSAGSCAAVGYYTDGSPSQQGLLLDATAASPALSASGPASGSIGKEIAASALSATLSGGMAPVGMIRFKVFGPQSSPPSACASGGTAVGSANVAGNRTYHPSKGFTPRSAGIYRWYASYGGDVSDRPAASACGTLMAKTVVPPAHLLSVAKKGSGAGSVTSSPAGIRCGPTCSHRFDQGTTVTLKATPGQGSRFAGFTGGGCSGTGPCKVTMSSDRTVTATFTRPAS